MENGPVADKTTTQVPDVKVVCEKDNLENSLPLLEGKASSLKGDAQDVDIGDFQERERASWGGKIEFLLTCVGYAVGLGNVWRFPFLCYKNGGGAFLIPYCVMLALVGLPLFFLEFAFGQFASLGPISVWNISPLFKGVGFAMVSVSWLLSLYYNVIIAHCLFYLGESFTSILPWESCGHWWNSENCSEFTFVNKTLNGSLGLNISAAANWVNHSLNLPSPSQEFYTRYILQEAVGFETNTPPTWRMALCLFFAWAIVLAALLKGIETLGKVAYFTAIFPYFMLTILLIRGVTLPGAMQGIYYYLTPDFSRLTDARVWTDAATQIFFSLSCCNGGLIAMSSYNKFKNNCCRDAVIVALLNCATSVFAGFVVFSNLGFMANRKGVTVDKVAKGGPGLVFVVYPEALTHLPVSPLWSVLFFIMMATLGFGSQFSIVETVLSGIQDELITNNIIREEHKKRDVIIFRVLMVILSFLLGIPMLCGAGMHLLNLMDWSVSGFPLLVVALFELLVISWGYGYRQFAKDIKLMIDSRPNLYWKVTWCVVSPLVLVFLLLFFFIMFKGPTYNEYIYPNWAVALSWLIAFFPLMFIPTVFIYRYCAEGGWILFTEYLKPVQEWGPAQREHRTEFISMIRSNESMNRGSDVPECQVQEDGFFQSKMSVVSKLSRAASRESGINRVRTHTNSFTYNPNSDVTRLAGSAGSGLAYAGILIGDQIPTFTVEGQPPDQSPSTQTKNASAAPAVEISVKDVSEYGKSNSTVEGQGDQSTE